MKTLCSKNTINSTENSVFISFLKVPQISLRKPFFTTTSTGKNLVMIKMTGVLTSTYSLPQTSMNMISLMLSRNPQKCVGGKKMILFPTIRTQHDQFSRKLAIFNGPQLLKFLELEAGIEICFTPTMGAYLAKRASPSMCTHQAQNWSKN